MHTQVQQKSSSCSYEGLRVVDSSKSQASMLRTRGTHAGPTEVKFLFARGTQGRGFEQESGVNVENSRYTRRYNRSQVLVCTRGSGSWIRARVGAPMLRTRGTHAGTTEVKFLFARWTQDDEIERERNDETRGYEGPG